MGRLDRIQGKRCHREPAIEPAGRMISTMPMLLVTDRSMQDEGLGWRWHRMSWRPGIDREKHIESGSGKKQSHSHRTTRKETGREESLVPGSERKNTGLDR